MKEEFRTHKKFFRIGEAARILNMHPQTLRLYDRKGVVKPKRIGNQRVYSSGDIYLINCIRDMIHREGFNLNSLSIVLKKVDCWEINRHCEKSKRENCVYYLEHHKRNGYRNVRSS